MARVRFPPPPTERVLKAFEEALEYCVFLESAGFLAGIPRKTLLAWIEAGRLGVPEYTRFVDMIDEKAAIISRNVFSIMHKEAFENKNMAALKFIYDARVKRQEERFNKKMDEIEDRLEEASIARPDLTEEELLELENALLDKQEKGLH